MTEPPEDPESESPVAVLAIEDSIDLHGFQPRDILNVVVDYLEAAQARGYREVRLIHGRGTGTQRARVQALLQQLSRVELSRVGFGMVEGFKDAPASRGGWGATLVYLRQVP